MISNLNLKKFNMSEITPDKVVVFIGKRNTGKSFLVKDLLYHVKDIPTGAIISGTEEANPFYSNILPSTFIYDEFSEDIVYRLLKRQKKIKQKLESEIKNNSYSNINPHTFLILDDLMDSASEWIKSKFIKTCFMNGRHYNMLFILTMQFSLGLPPALRGNTDYIFILREPIISNRKRLYEHYAGALPSFEIFCSVMDQCTTDHQCLVIKNCCSSNKLEDQIFWYVGEDHGPFKIGSPQLWQFHDSKYNNNNDSEEDKLVPKKKNSSKLFVKKMK